MDPRLGQGIRLLAERHIHLQINDRFWRPIITSRTLGCGADFGGDYFFQSDTKTDDRMAIPIVLDAVE